MTTFPCLRVWLAACGLVLLPGTPVVATTQAPPGAADLVIDGPPSPLPPQVMARDSRGRVTIRAERLDRPLRVDGVLDDEPYGTVQAISDFIQQEPREGEPST